jgi:hypothetical protein
MRLKYDVYLEICIGCSENHAMNKGIAASYTGRTHIQTLLCGTTSATVLPPLSCLYTMHHTTDVFTNCYVSFVLPGWHCVHSRGLKAIYIRSPTQGIPKILTDAKKQFDIFGVYL